MHMHYFDHVKILQEIKLQFKLGHAGPAFPPQGQDIFGKRKISPQSHTSYPISSSYKDILTPRRRMSHIPTLYVRFHLVS